MRTRTVFVAALAFVVAVVGTVAAVRALDRRTHEFASAATGPVIVTAPRAAGALRFTPLPAPDPATLPPGLNLPNRPVKIEAELFEGEARVTFPFDPASLPVGADPASDLYVVSFIPELGSWLPVGNNVDSRASTVSAVTSHFSAWALAVVDPQALSDRQEMSERLAASTGGTVAEWIFGKRDTLSCDPSRPLLPATVREPIAQGTELCQEVLDDGTHRLQYVNTSGMPRILRLPNGFVEEQPDESFDTTIGRILASRTPGTTVVTNGQSLAVRFPGDAVGPDTEITGDTDWNVYFVAMFRSVFAALLLDKAPAGTDPGKLADIVDRWFLAPDVIDCADAAAVELRRSGDVAQAARAGLVECASAVADGIVAVVDAIHVQSRFALTAFLRRAVAPVLAIPELMELVRAEMNGLLVVVGKYGYDLDTTVTIRPARVAGAGDLAALPSGWWDGSTVDRECVTMPAPTVLPGVPAEACVSAVDVDLDGNGRADRLILWREPFDSDSIDPLDAGATAYLDDGTHRMLESPLSAWPTSERPYGNLVFAASRALTLGDDDRTQVVITLETGANTHHHRIIALDTDRRLRFATGPGGSRFALFTGGGAGYSSAFGCVTSGGAPRLATLSSSTIRHPGRTAAAQYGWSREFYRFDDVTLTAVGREGGVTSSRAGQPPAGSDCAETGPEIGATHSAGRSPDETIGGFMRAVLEDDRSGVSRYIAGDLFNYQWANGLGGDAWVEARRATQTDRAAWRDALSDCAPPTPDEVSEPARRCVVAGPDERVLFLRLAGLPTGEWVVTGALGQ